MEATDIVRYLKQNILPLEYHYEGLIYRASVTMKDGLFLPCVVFKNKEHRIKHAMKRLEEERTGKGIFHKSVDGYYEIVKTFVTGGNLINDYDIKSVEPSRFAFSPDIQSKIQGETTMGWTGFVVRMKDEKQYAFGSTFSWEFFDLPEGYSSNDIKEIINHSYLDENGLIKSYHSNRFINFDKLKVYRERTLFNCFVDGL